MQEGMFLQVFAAGWLGLLCAVSPCPLATNIAALGFIARQPGKGRTVFLSGLLYTLGRTLTYVLIGAFLYGAMEAAPNVSMSLQRVMNLILGPLLILVAMVLLKLIVLPLPAMGNGSRLEQLVRRGGLLGAGLLGILFALTFCPTSAALFFGGLLPMMAASDNPMPLSVAFGLMTGLPVFAFALLLAFGTRRVGVLYGCLAQIERWAGRVTGIVFLVVGIYFTLTMTLKVL